MAWVRTLRSEWPAARRLSSPLVILIFLTCDALLCILQSSVMFSCGNSGYDTLILRVQRHGSSIRDSASLALISLLRWMMNSSIRDFRSGPEIFVRDV